MRNYTRNTITGLDQNSPIALKTYIRTSDITYAKNGMIQI